MEDECNKTDLHEEDEPEQCLESRCSNSEGYLSLLDDAEVVESLKDAWDLYHSGRGHPTRSSLYKILEEASTRDECKEVTTDIIRKLIDDLYSQCHTNSMDSSKVRILSSINLFNRLIYKLGKLGYNHILAEYPAETAKIKEIEENARSNADKPYNNAGNRGPEKRS